MNDVDEDVLAGRRRTWMVGGLLLLTTGLAWTLSELGIAPVGLLGLVTEPLAFIVFAIGLGRGGSVTARRPVGTIALAGLGVLVVAQPLVRMVLNGMPMGEGPQAAEQYAVMHQNVGIALEVTALVLAVVAVVAIVMAGVVPSPWRWLPVVALIVALIARALPLLRHGPLTMDALLTVLRTANLLNPLMLLILGAAAVVLAARSRSRLPFSTLA